MVNLFSKPPRRRNTFLQTSSPLGRTTRAREGWRPLKLDGTIALISFIFVLIGLLFTYSSSAFETTQYVKRQLLFDIVGLIAAGFLSQMYTRLQRMKLFRPINLLLFTWVLLVIVLFTREQANTHRWIDLGFIKIQPSEIAKVTLVIYIADCLDKVSGTIAKNWRAMIHPIIMAGITLLLIIAEKDLGIPALMGGVFLAMLFVAGAKWWHVTGMMGLAGMGVIVQMLAVPYRRARLFSFLHLGNYTDNSTNYQVMQSFLAVGSGGWLGKGLGNSELKMQYLPAAHTDFIFSVMCEEVGLFVLLIVAGFTWLLIRGVMMARIAKTTFNSLVIFGLTLTLCAQAFFNMAMAIGLAPTKGIALPFFSYGGTSVVMTLVMIGIILNLIAVDKAPSNYREDLTQYKNRNRL